ncbi:MAG: hypothetical protein JO119_10015, partial [Acidobacteria bacterium]|nr:hypothetical protein [Acidobacteriota bacterium]
DQLVWRVYGTCQGGHRHDYSYKRGGLQYVGVGEGFGVGTIFDSIDTE